MRTPKTQFVHMKVIRRRSLVRIRVGNTHEAVLQEYEVNGEVVDKSYLYWTQTKRFIDRIFIFCCLKSVCLFVQSYCMVRGAKGIHLAKVIEPTYQRGHGQWPRAPRIRVIVHLNNQWAFPVKFRRDLHFFIIWGENENEREQPTAYAISAECMITCLWILLKMM